MGKAGAKKPAAPKKSPKGGVSKSATPKAKSGASVALQCELKDSGWRSLLAEEFTKPYFLSLTSQVMSEYDKKQVFPPLNQVFQAFNTTPVNKVKVLLLGQDPYHDDGQAHGLSFSVPPGKTVPPSLKNIYKELDSDLGIKIDPVKAGGCLLPWSKRGVFLLNATLTVEAHRPNSHSKLGWQQFTDAVIRALSQRGEVVFLLWGGFAQKKAKLIDTDRNRVVQTAHPSPLSAKLFLGCKCFSKVNAALKELGQQVIDWSL